MSPRLGIWLAFLALAVAALSGAGAGGAAIAPPLAVRSRIGLANADLCLCSRLG